VDDLEEQVAADPVAAVDELSARLVQCEDASERAALLRLRAVAFRRQRAMHSARLDLDEARRLVATTGDVALTRAVGLTLAGVMAYASEFVDALELVNALPDTNDPVSLGHGATQRAFLLQRLGDVEGAEREYASALALAPHGTPIDLADLLSNRGIMRTYAGRFDDAEDDLRRALQLYRDEGAEHQVTETLHNLAWTAGRGGHLVSSLQLFDEAARRYDEANVDESARYPDECEVLLAAGLFTEAFEAARRSARALLAAGDLGDAAEVLLLEARAALAADRPAEGRAAAMRAHELFSAAGRAGWAAEARLLDAAAAVRLTERHEGPELMPDLRALADDLDRGGLHSAAVDARLAEARRLVTIGRAADARELAIGCLGPHPSVQQRLASLTVVAQAAEDAGDDDGILRAARAGTDLLDELRATVGADELRAHLASHGASLTDAAVSTAVRRRSAAQVIAWDERRRAAASTGVRLRRPTDASLARALDDLRECDRRLADLSRSDDLDVDEIARWTMRRGRTSRRAVARSRLVDPSQAAAGRVTLAALRRALGVGQSRASVMVADGDRLVGVDVTGAGARLADLGSIGDVMRDAERLGPALRRLLFGGSDDRLRAAAAPLLEASADRLDRRLFAHVGDDDRRLVIVVPPQLNRVPWAVLPTLRARPFVVVSSLSRWALRQPDAWEPPGTTVLVSGSDLAHGVDEVAAIRAVHRAATVLGSVGGSVGGGDGVGQQLSTESILGALDGADLAHLACHGARDVESPLFSSLQLPDGPLYAYDLDTLRLAPRVVVLSSCHVARDAAPIDGELLGVVSTLVARGSRAVVGSTIAVPDSPATVDFMCRVHRDLAAGIEPADALARARRGSSPEDRAVGWAFSCFAG
jgi:tetratricopeptide (TPR) repeat protein